MCSAFLLKRVQRVVDFNKIYLVRADALTALCEIKAVKSAYKLSIIPVVEENGVKTTIDPNSVREIYEICVIFIM